MSCQAQATRFAGLAGRWSGGINRLSSQQAFYSGLAVGAIGSGLMSLLVAKRAALGQLLNRWRAGSAEPVKKERPVNPARPIPGLGTIGQRGLKQAAQPIPALAARSQPVKLQAGPVRMQLGQAQSYTADSYRLVRADGSETGLALTPYLAQQEPTGKVARTEQWGLTHLGSGALVSGPYRNVAEAQALGQQLAALDWTKARLSAADSERVKNIIQAYDQRRAE